MWTFRDVSFVPHALTGTDDEVSIHIGHGAPPAGFADLLINTATDVPSFYDAFERVAEIVAGDEASKKRGRRRFKHYRDQGIEPETHEI